MKRIKKEDLFCNEDGSECYIIPQDNKLDRSNFKLETNSIYNSRDFDALFDTFLIEMDEDFYKYLDEYDFDTIPPVIGIIVSDKFGKPSFTYEYNEQLGDDEYHSLMHYFYSNEHSLDLIVPMLNVINSAIDDATRLDDLTNFEIRSSNMKVRVYFALEKINIHLILNTNTQLNSKIQTIIIDHFRRIINENEEEIDNHLRKGLTSGEFIDKLKKNGTKFLKDLNDVLLYLHMVIIHGRGEKFSDIISFKKFIRTRRKSIHNKISPHLENTPNDLIEDLIEATKDKMSNKWRKILREKF